MALPLCSFLSLFPFAALLLSASMSPAVSLRTGKGVALSLCFWLERQFALVFPPDNADCAAAAPASRIVAACAPLQWLLPRLPPLGVAQNSQIGGYSLACRRVIRRQFSQLCHFSP